MTSSHGGILVKGGRERLEKGSGDRACTLCLYLRLGQLVPGDREIQVGLEIPEEKEKTSPPPFKQNKAPLSSGRFSLYKRPGALRTLDGTWVPESCLLRAYAFHRARGGGCIKYTQKGCSESLPREPDCPGPLRRPLS